MKKLLLTLAAASLALSANAADEAIISQVRNNKLGNNCVLFARSKVPSLPYGLFTLQSKVNIINSSTPGTPNNTVAIIDTGIPEGHVAVVTDYGTYKGSYYIKTQDANNPPGTITSHKYTGSSLQEVKDFALISGFFNAK